MTLPIVPSIPTVPTTTDMELAGYLSAVKTVLDSMRNDDGSYGGTSAAVVEELATQIAAAASSVAETVEENISGTIPPENIDPAFPPATSPPVLGGLVITPGFSSVIVSWDTIPYGHGAYTKIYRAAVDDFTQATMVGTSIALLYSDYLPNSNTYYYWITSMSEYGVEGPPNQTAGTTAQVSFDPQYTLEVLEDALTGNEIRDGVILEAHIGTAVVLNAFIQNLGADKIAVTDLSALTANMGTVTAGQLVSPDNTFIIDMAAKQIMISGPNGQASDDYTVLQNGTFQAYKWDGAQHVPSKALRGMASGVAANGATIVISEVFFTEQPSIIVTPRDIVVYDNTQSNVSQQLRIMAENIQETSVGSGTWQFDVIAELNSTDGSENVVINESEADSSANTQQSSVYTTTDNVSEINVDLNLKSYAGESSDASNFYYYYRRCTIRLYYRLAGSGDSYSNTTGTVRDLGATRLSVNVSAAFALTQQSHEFYVHVTFSNVSTTTFSEPSGGYDYATSTVYPTGVTAEVDAPAGVWGSSGSDTDGGVLTQAKSISISASPPAGYSTSGIYNVTYTWDSTYTYEATYYENSGGASKRSYTAIKVIDASGTIESEQTSSAGSPSQITISGGTTSSNRTENGSSYVTSYELADVEISCFEPNTQNAWSASGNVSLTTNGVSVKHDYRKVKTISTTPVNKLIFNAYTATIAGGTTINTGTLNWQAIGQ